MSLTGTLLKVGPLRVGNDLGGQGSLQAIEVLDGERAPGVREHAVPGPGMTAHRSCSGLSHGCHQAPELRKVAGLMPGMNSGINANDPTVVAAFRAALAHQGVIALLIFILLAL